MQNLKRYMPSKLSIRLLLIVLVISTGITLVTSCILLYSDYKKDLEAINDHQIRIQNVDLKELTLDLWEFDWPKVELKLKGLLNYPEISYAYVVLNGGERVSKGDPKRHEFSEVKDYPLLYKQKELGTLFVQVDYNYVYERLKDKAFNILLIQFFNTFMVSVLIMILVHLMITRHLITLANYTRKLSFDSLDSEPFELKRPHKEDELAAVTTALNKMKSNLKMEFENRKQIEVELLSERSQLAALNKELENKVNERTGELQRSNNELSIALNNVNNMIEQLQNTQKELIVKEKMLATGGMVVGLAHELNTPLGVCKTSVSAVADFVTQIRDDINNQKLTKDTLNTHLESIYSLATMSEDNIDRISAMINTFKELSVKEEVVESIAEVKLQECFMDVNKWAGGNLRGGLTIHIECPSNFTIETFESSLHKVIQALVENAALHAFKQDEAGNIYLKARPSEKQSAVIITVSDDGIGIKKDEHARIFEPFYTTKRNQGGLGLGLNIVYNLVTQALSGSIRCIDSKYGGCCFEVTLPTALSESDIEAYRNKLNASPEISDTNIDVWP